MDFDELVNDSYIVAKVMRITATLDRIEESVRDTIEYTDYESLTAEQKVKYDLYLSYAMNSLFFMYVRLQGRDPNKCDIKNELARVRQAMIRERQLIDRNTIRPVLDREVVERFIKHGLNWRNLKDDDEKDETDNEGDEENDVEGDEENMPKNKITKFND